MKKEEIVNFFLQKGLNIDPSGLEYFYENPEEIKKFLEKTEKMDKKPTMVNLEVIKKLIKEGYDKIEVIKKFPTPMKKVSVDDISKNLAERYEKIRKFFLNRIDLVNPISINKITPKTRRFSLVAMVREKNEENKTILVEDMTGEITTHINNLNFDSIVTDEVLGLTCERNDDRIEVVGVLWPDIPLKREISRLEEDVYCMFLSDLQLNQEFDSKAKKILGEIRQLTYKQLYIFLFGDKSTDNKSIERFVEKLPEKCKVIVIYSPANPIETKNANYFSSPSFLTVGGKINMLLCDGELFSIYKSLWNKKKPEEVMLNLLKKRHLDPIFKPEKLFMEDHLMIEPVPDIFVSGNLGSPGILNYKGTTIISCGGFSTEPLYWILNLRTRESIKISLA